MIKLGTNDNNYTGYLLSSDAPQIEFKSISLYWLLEHLEFCCDGGKPWQHSNSFYMFVFYPLKQKEEAQIKLFTVILWHYGE